MPKPVPKAPRAPRRPARRARPSAPAGDALELALAALAHEIRTPLNGILAFAELLAVSGLPARERAWAAAIKSAAEHLAQFTTVVVEGAKARGPGLLPQHESFDPRRLAAEVAASLQARAAVKGLQAEARIGELPAQARGDPVRLRAALENLIDNAVKFTARGRVRFAARAEPVERGRVRLLFTVADEGIGMSPRELARLFRPFAQAGAQTARRFGGAGLGLAFARSIARAMDGDLVASSTPGEGTSFVLSTIVAPVEDAAASYAAGDSATATPPARALRILCAEDNPYGRLVTNTIAAALGHTIDFVEDGDSAVEAVRAQRPDLVLMDLVLPGVGGIEAARRIRALAGSPGRVPIIGLSGQASAAAEQAARAAGMNDYLTKPVSPAALARAIAAALNA